MAGETIVDDQRQRTLKALERRFEAAQVELDLHQKKTVKRSKTDEAGRKSQIASSSAVNSLPNLANPSASSSTPFKKDVGWPHPRPNIQLWPTYYLRRQGGCVLCVQQPMTNPWITDPSAFENVSIPRTHWVNPMS